MGTQAYFIPTVFCWAKKHGFVWWYGRGCVKTTSCMSCKWITHQLLGWRKLQAPLSCQHRTESLESGSPGRSLTHILKSLLYCFLATSLDDLYITCQLCITYIFIFQKCLLIEWPNWPRHCVSVMTKKLTAYRSVDISALKLTIELVSCFIQGS